MGKLTINPRRWYTLKEIAEHKMFPWASSYLLTRRIITDDLKGKKRLHTVTMGKGFNVRYQVKGEHIIKFIKAVETGAVRL